MQHSISENKKTKDQKLQNFEDDDQENENMKDLQDNNSNLSCGDEDDDLDTFSPIKS